MYCNIYDPLNTTEYFLQVEKFFNPSLENKVERRIVLPPLNDDIQLSVEEYRYKLYEIIHQDKAR